MISLIRHADIDLPRVVDPAYRGRSDSRFRVTYTSPDRNLFCGLWTFSGEHVTPVHDGYTELLTIIGGTLEIECDDRSYVAVPGDVVVYECPVPPQRLRARGLVRASFVIRRTEGSDLPAWLR
jgi:quercetin dioxygenase-like cupin family protein